MVPKVERRRRDSDPCEVLSPEVLAVLKLCGGLRKGDEKTLPAQSSGLRMFSQLMPTTSASTAKWATNFAVGDTRLSWDGSSSPARR